jgi:peptidoglycan/LPS O-acetylase OafA/YrhL
VHAAVVMTETRVERALGHRPALDGLRAVAIGLVLLEHTGLSIFDGGNNGVIVFFVLSGFLITKLLIEEWDRTGTVSIKNFYGRRTVRIMPAPFVMILVLLALSWWIVDDPRQHNYFLFELLLAATYITNLRPILFGGIPLYVERTYLAHMWSLSVEEHFYLIWPWGMRKLRLAERPVQQAVRFLIGFALAVTVLRAAWVILGVPDLVSISIFMFDGFAMGAALAFALHHGAYPRFEAFVRQSRVATVGFAILAVDLVSRGITGGIDYAYVTYCSLATVAIIGYTFLAEDGWYTRILSFPVMTYIGKLSYSIYLWHVPIMAYFSKERFPEMSVIELALIEWPLTLLVSMGSYHIIEKRFMRLRKRFVS